MSDREMITVVLNALPEEWGIFTSSIYGEKEVTPFQDLWSLCKIEESRLKEKSYIESGEQNQAYVTMTKRKGNFGNFGSRKKKRDMSKVQCYGCQEYGHYKSKRTKEKE